MSDEKEAIRELSPAYRAGVYLFVSLYFTVAIITLLPKSPAQRRLLAFVSPLTHTFNLSQNWKLFSPELREINFNSAAVIEFADGTSKLYEFPRLEEMSRWDAFRRQKLCKLFQDSMPWPDFALFWPDVARYLARANYDALDPKNPPTQITLSYNWVKIKDIAEFEKQSDLEAPNKRATVFIYRVQPEDLR